MITETLTKCYNCKNTIDPEEGSQENDGNLYCQSCFDDIFTTCYDCGDSFKTDEMLYQSGDYYCRSCYDDNFSSCDDCGDDYPIDDLIGVANGNSICQDCRDSNYYSCYECGEIYHEDNCHYCEDCSDYLCDDCWEEHEHNRRYASEFSFKQGKICKEMPFFDYVGVEIETFSHQRVPELDFIQVDDDGSISPDFGESCEIKTLPASGDTLVKNIKTLSRELKAGDFGVNSSCGLHIHIDCRKIKDKPIKIGQMLQTFMAFEDILYSMLPKSRWGSTYCKPLFDDYDEKELKAKTIQEFCKKWYKTDYYTDQINNHYADSRYHDINAHSLFYRGTIEVRMHSGTIDSEKILNWIYVLLKIKKWSLNNYNEKTIKKAMKMTSNQKKLNLFLKTFGFKDDKKEYILARIKKFNPLLLTTRGNYWDTKRKLKTFRKSYYSICEIKEQLTQRAIEAYRQRLRTSGESAPVGMTREKIMENYKQTNKYYQIIDGKWEKQTQRLHKAEKKLNDQFYRVRSQED